MQREGRGLYKINSSRGRYWIVRLIACLFRKEPLYPLISTIVMQIIEVESWHDIPYGNLYRGYERRVGKQEVSVEQVLADHKRIHPDKSAKAVYVSKDYFYLIEE